MIILCIAITNDNTDDNDNDNDDEASGSRPTRSGDRRRCTGAPRLGQHYLSNATCLIQASFVLCVFRGVKDHRMLLHSSPLLKKNLR